MAISDNTGFTRYSPHGYSFSFLIMWPLILLSWPKRMMPDRQSSDRLFLRVSALMLVEWNLPAERLLPQAFHDILVAPSARDTVVGGDPLTDPRSVLADHGPHVLRSLHQSQ